ncbi:glycosyltransferase family 2 protein [Arthrobacter sp. Sa2CUA1]|uniref:4,4'-diaponeurosporenoate glycosyltransferase n=1 Tax=Arthrobacter gallicola TaxID=2762225 RepID=A0ABR8UQV0_9MICC|nr:glycosyltransferase family A protein [Arthrobacter gallicola]MBD7994893.1 glycosyltransferase family 2 protein [Arthrobacter gallicola]
MTPRHTGVVIPARNEEELLPRCLAAVAAAVKSAESEGPARVSVAVVLDSCTDRSAAAAAKAGRDHGLELHLLETAAGTVGAARALGVEAAVRLGAQWIANTDADTVVPRNWLLTQHQLAEAGYGLILGTVVPDSADLTPEHLSIWHSRHQLGENHPHVHGANLGFSAESYAAGGGFASAAVHEDIQLAERIKAAGVPWLATDWIRAVTSGRRDGRTPEGFSGFLRQLLN